MAVVEPSRRLQITLCTAFLALICCVVSMFTDYWISFGGFVHMGLFKICTLGNCTSLHDNPDEGLRDSMRWILIKGGIGLFFALVAVILYAVDFRMHSRCIMGFGVFATVAAAGPWLELSIETMLSGIPMSFLGWSFHLALVGCAFHLITLVLSCSECCTRRPVVVEEAGPI